MSTAEKLEQKGYQRGRADGKAEGKAEVLVCLLRERFRVLDEAVVRRIQSAPPSDLDRWTRRILHADTIAFVFAD